ncbi:hypothetical protein [Streptomyces sp. SID3343]|uniref:hypothetical protein n=1 Tax=Streptomyces sp. SID3343 TaxID=2690260 RepID=UPI0013713A89|nr:hypothetical protein [Streptomyces sp. SID3343]MYW04134.1 hypothetical protein [Streptomyces sp. SID3343]
MGPLTSQATRRTQSRLAGRRHKATTALQLLTQALDLLAAGQALPPADRRHKDFFNAAERVLRDIRKLL